MAINVRVWGRRIHRTAAIITALPFLVILLTGFLLQMRGEYEWVQPPTQEGQKGDPTVSFEAILSAAKGVPEAGVATWADVERIDVRPNEGIAKVICKNRVEVQVDLRTGKVLQTAPRRSDLIASIHNGSFFHEAAEEFVFVPTAVILLVLWTTGLYLWVLPLAIKFRRKKL